MKKTLLLVFALSFLFAAQVMASGSSGVPGPATSRGVPSSSLIVTHTMQCVVTHIRADGTVFVQDKPGSPEHPLRFTKKTRISAGDRKQFDVRKKLEVADLKVGPPGSSPRSSARPPAG